VRYRRKRGQQTENEEKNPSCFHGWNLLTVVCDGV